MEENGVMGFHSCHNSCFIRITRPCGRAIALLAVAGLISSCDQQPPKPQPVKVGVVVTAVVPYERTVSLTGEVAPRVSSELSFRASGRIQARKVDVGDHVVAGQVLATLLPDQEQAAVAAAEANVRSAEATVAQTSAAFDRQAKLIASGFATRRDYDQAQEAFRSAQGSLDVAKAQLGIARDELNQTALKADADGVITARNAEAGEVVQTAQTIFTLAQDGPRDAVFNVSESILVGAPEDTTINVALVAAPKVQALAKPREISPVVDATTGTVRMKFEIDHPPATMTLGAPVIGTGRYEAQPAIILPWTALFSGNDKPAVWMVDPSTKSVSLKPIEIGAFETGLIVVRSGLEPGQMVVSRGGQLMRPGEVVLPEEDPKS